MDSFIEKFTNVTTIMEVTAINITALTSKPNIRNITSTSVDETCRLEPRSTVILVCYFIVFIVGTGGNILVLLSFRHYRKRGPTINLLILYLAFFDLLASIFVPFIFGYWLWTCDMVWHFGWFGCKILPVAARVFASVSIGILLIMAIDRCRVIKTPFKPRFKRSVIHISVAVTVFLSCISEIHYVKTLYIDEETGQCAIVAAEDYAYTLIIITLLRDITFIAIFVSTSLGVFIRLNRNSSLNIISSHTNSCRKREKQKKKVMKMFVVMATVFSVTVIPRDLFQVSVVTSHLLPQEQWIAYTKEVLLLNSVLNLLKTSNSIYNVFIYAGMSKDFWKNIVILGKTLRKSLSRRSNSILLDRGNRCPVSLYRREDSVLMTKYRRGSEIKDSFV